MFMDIGKTISKPPRSLYKVIKWNFFNTSFISNYYIGLCKLDNCSIIITALTRLSDWWSSTTWSSSNMTWENLLLFIWSILCSTTYPWPRSIVCQLLQAFFPWGSDLSLLLHILDKWFFQNCERPYLLFLFLFSK